MVAASSLSVLELPEGTKGIVFDCDGTLIDTMTLHWQSWREACAHFGLPLTLKWWQAQAGKTSDDIFVDLCAMQGLPQPADFQAWRKQRYATDLLPKVTAIEAVVEVARRALAQGIPIAVASGGSTAHVRAGLEVAGILHLFEVVVCAEDYANSKPAPDCFLLAAERLGVPPHQCVGFEDAVLGMQSIRAAQFLAAIDVTVLPDYPHIIE